MVVAGTRTLALLGLLVSSIADEPLTLTYFAVMAKGLAPALVLEVSGLPWEGRHPDDWAAMKPTTVFGQLPQLKTPDGFLMAQMAAIVNVISRRAPELLGVGEREFAVSQELLVFADDDLYRGMQKHQDTINKKDKVPQAELDEWWSKIVPGHLASLGKLMVAQGHGGDRFTSGGFTAGELVLWAILHQIKLVRPGVISATPAVSAFYNRIGADARVARVIREGGAFPGPLKQYFVRGSEAPEASLADEL